MRSVATALAGLAFATALAAQTPAPTATPTATQPAPPPPAVKLDYDSLAFGRQVTEWFYAGQADSLWAHSLPQVQEQLGSKEKWQEAYFDFTQHAGSETSLVEERFVKRNGHRQYWRVIRASDFNDEPVMIRWVLMPGKMIGGIGMNPASQAPPVDPN